MAKFLIEVPHSEDKYECTIAIKVFLNSGSHFLANADWGCKDGEHKAWLVVDVNDKNEARQILPPIYRNDAKITQLEKWFMEDLDESYKFHKTVTDLKK
jgi:hypothetical protein